MKASKSIFNVFTLLALLAMVISLLSASPAQAESLASPLQVSGDLLWAKSMGGAGDDYGRGIAVDSSGNVYTTGEFNGTVDFDPGAGTASLTSAGLTDIFVSKFDSSGNFVWAKSMGGTGFDNSFGITLDSNGNIYTTGYFQNTADFDPGASTATLSSAGGSDIFVSKLDSGGNYLWAKRLGGAGGDVASSIALDSSGNIYTTGGYGANADFDPGVGVFNLIGLGSYDIFVSKLDSDGNFVWAKGMGGTNDDSGKDIAIDSNGNIFTVGYFTDFADFDPGAGIVNLYGNGQIDIFISKLDGSGNFLWVKSIGGTNRDMALGVAVNTSGNVYMTGYFQDTADFDPGVGTANLTSAGGTEIFVSKLDGSGNFLWAKSMGGTGLDLASSIALDSSGNIYTTGSFQNTADFDPGAVTVNLTALGQDDIFVSKLDGNGNLAWVKRMGGSGYDGGYNIALDPSGNLYITGFYYDTADFDPGTGITSLTSTGLGDIFVSKLENDGVAPAITSFTATSPSLSLGIPITAFSASDIVGVTGYMITTSSTPPFTNDTGWSSTAPAIYTVGSESSYTLYPWAKDAAGNVSAIFGSPVNVTVDLAPSVSMSSTAANPTHASPITVSVTFSENVSNFISSDITTSNGTVSNFAGSGASYTFDLTPTANGLVTADIAAGVAQDGAGNENTAASQFSRTYDNVAPIVASFTAASSSSNLNIPITAFTATDAGGVTGYMITTSATPPTIGNAGWSGTVPTTYAVGTDRIYTLYPWAKDAAGNVSSVFASPVNVTVDATAPTTVSSLRVNTTPTATASVDFIVTFSEPVTGVGTDDFSLVASGISGATVSGVSGSSTTYTVTVNTGTGNGTIRLDVPVSATITDLVGNPLTAGFSSGEIYTVIKSATFTDTPLSYWANSYIERLYNAGITGGCGAGVYCPDSSVTRAQMAVFILKGMHGSSFTPPAVDVSTGFTDVAANYWAAAWIKELAAEGITGGCGTGVYCPDATVTRAQMAVFLLKAKHGSSYSPPTATGVFTDVPTNYWAASWIEQLATEGVTSGCGTGTYCPDNSVTRAQMAVFLVKAFGLP